jgi:tetratricopeptide (TPR) repeat protein
LSCFVATVRVVVSLARGWIALMCNEPEGAIKSFEQSFALNPLDPRRGLSWNGIAFAHFILGNHEKGAALAKKAVELTADTHSLGVRIAHEVRAGLPDDARRHARELMNIRPDFAPPTHPLCSQYALPSSTGI